MANGRNFKLELNRILPTFAAMLFGNYMENLVTQLNAVRADNATLRTAVNTLATKLNADAGVTDTNYAQVAATTSSAVTLPSAIV